MYGDLGDEAAHDAEVVAAAIPAVPVAVGHDLNTQPQAADYGGWTLFKLAGTEAPQLILPYDGNRHRATILASLPVTPGGTAPPASVNNFGQVTNPVAGQTITSVTLPAGTYQVAWTVGLGGTTAAGDANNFQLVNGVAVVLNSMNSSTSGNFQQQPTVNVIVPAGGGTVSVQAVANAAAATSIYRAQLSATLVTTPAVGFVYLGSQAQCLQKLGGIVQAGQTVVVENNQQLWMAPDGTDPIWVSVLAERWDSGTGQ